MVGPDLNGRFWIIVIKYIGSGMAEPITAWPAKRAQTHGYPETPDETT
jgi:hypothetical protein